MADYVYRPPSGLTGYRYQYKTGGGTVVLDQKAPLPDAFINSNATLNRQEIGVYGQTVGAPVAVTGTALAVTTSDVKQDAATAATDTELAAAGAAAAAAYAAFAATPTTPGIHKNTPDSRYGDWFSFGNVVDSNGGAATGTPAVGWGPFVTYHAYGQDGPITGTTQAGYFVYRAHNVTTDDSMQCLSAAVVWKDSGSPQTQNKKVVGFESDVQIEGGNIVASGVYGLTMGGRIILNDTSNMALGYGAKVSAATGLNHVNSATGTMGQWQGLRDDLFNPAGTSRDHNESVHGVNRITTEQSFLAQRVAGYGAKVQIDLAGTGGGSSALMLLQMPSPGAGGNTTTIADGAFTSGQPRVTTATAPTDSWIGRGITNANVPAGTQVMNWYANGGGTYTVVMNANATGTASGQSVTFAELDLVGIRINQAAAGTTTARPFEYYQTGGSLPTAFLARTGVWGTTGSYQILNSALDTTLMTMSSAGLTFGDGKNLIAGTTTGTKIGTATTQKLGFFNATPVVQQGSTPAAATDLATALTLVNDLRTKLLTYGLAA